MAKTELILTKPIFGLGAESDQVTVAAGYARNYLLPEGLAIPVTAANKRRLDALKRRRAERESQELNSMTELARSLNRLICVITVKTGDEGKLFGSVTAGMIADELKNQFDVSLDKRKIRLGEPLRSLGEHEIELHLHPEVKGTLKVRIDSSTPIAAPPVAEEKEATKEEGKAEELRKEKRKRPAKKASKA